MKTFEQYNKKDRPKVGDVLKQTWDDALSYVIITKIDDNELVFPYNIIDIYYDDLEFGFVGEEDNAEFGVDIQDEEYISRLDYHSNVFDFFKKNIQLYKKLKKYIDDIIEDNDTVDSTDDSMDSIYTAHYLLNELEYDKDIQLLIDSEDLGLL